MAMHTYRYRLYPSSKQRVRLITSFKVCKSIYNELLAISIDAWKFGKISLNKFDYNSYVKDKDTNLFSQSKQNVSDRIHKSFQNFFRRIKSKSKKKGFPRFKNRVCSITYPQSGFKLLNKQLHVSKVGDIPLVMHRVPKGKIKTMTIKQNKANQWFATFACEIEILKKQHKGTKIGIDMGLENYVATSDGQFFDNPRHLVKSEERLKLLQRRLSRKVKGSRNRYKSRFRLAVLHVKIANQRTDFLHKLSHQLTIKYSFIAVENLNIKKMLQTHSLAKHISDAGWNQFIAMLSYKAVTCGGQAIAVNSANTSKRCSRCGAMNDMPLSKRELICSDCGFECHRDTNASMNILTVGTDCAEHNACGDSVSTAEKSAASRIVEAGTTCKSIALTSAGSPVI